VLPGVHQDLVMTAPEHSAEWTGLDELGAGAHDAYELHASGLPAGGLEAQARILQTRRQTPPTTTPISPTMMAAQDPVRMAPLRPLSIRPGTGFPPTMLRLRQGLAAAPP